MFQSILRLSRHTLIYGVGNIMTRVVWFLLLPVMTNVLPPDQFGVQVLYYILIAVAMEVVRLGQDIALLRFYVPEKDLEKRQRIFSSVFWAAFGLTTIISMTLWFGAEFFTGLIIDQPEPYPHWMIYTLKLAALIVWVDNLKDFPLVVMRCENQPGRFLFAKLTGVVVQAGLTLWLLIGLKHGVPGIFEGNLAGSALTLLICLPTLFGRLRFVFNKAIFLSCLAFGLPNVPNVLFVQIVELADRKILELLRSAAEVGIYSAGYKLGMFLAVVAAGFRFAWQPFFMQISDRPDAKDVYSRVLTYYVAVAVWIYLLLVAFIGTIARWEIPGAGSMIDPRYWSGIDVFPVISLAHIFNGMFAVFVVGIYIEKRTRILPWITGCAAIVNIVGNLLLVPRYGMWASAWMTVLSYGLMALLLYVYIQRVYPIRYEWKRVLHIAVAAAVIYASGEFARAAGHAWLIYILSVIFPLVLLSTGLATEGEKARIGIRPRGRV